MTNEVAQLGKDNIQAMAMPETELLEVLGRSLYPGAAPASIKLALGYCKASGLDPMQKPVHIVPMWDSKARETRDVIMPGIGLYRTQAVRSGEYAGVSEPEYGEDVTETIDGCTITYPKWCKVVVKRLLSNGAIAEFSATERWKENYAVKGGKAKSHAPNAMWYKRPYGQLGKCAEAQALRKAFPECGSQPTADEMEGKVIDITNQTDANVTENQPKPEPVREFMDDESFAKNLPTYTKMIESGAKSASELIAFLASKKELTPDQCEALNKIKASEVVDAEVVNG